MTIIEKEWFIEAPWGRLCIVAWGHCHSPPVLVCHGSMDTVLSFRPLIKLLPNNFYYIGVELPGNGKSDPFPPGLLMNAYDLVYCLEVVVKHFRWENFVFLGHSAGASVGMLYDFCLPGKMTKLIQLDPVFATVEPDVFATWYKKTCQALFDDFDYYYDQKRRRPAYTIQEALKKLLAIEGMTEEQAEGNLGRLAEDVGNGLVRFTADMRYKIMSLAPLTPNQLKSLCQKSNAQVLMIAADQSIKQGRYSKTQFLFDESNFSNGYRARQVDAHHNIHMSPPQTMVTWISQFLINGPEGLDAKSKL